MVWDLVVTDMLSRNRAFLTDWETLEVTRRLGGYCHGTVTLNIYDKNAAEILIGQRAIKFYRGPTLQLYGTIWEPLTVNHPKGITVVVRDPYAYLPWRRNRTLTTYTTTDAGAIVTARLAAQNALGTTHLRMGSVDTSINRTLTINPGKVEAETIEDLSGMTNGFFFKVNAVDGVPGTFSEIVVKYPNAGSTRESVRFEYGPVTADNQNEVEIIYNLPRNREVAASSAAVGGRITGIVEDLTSQALYGIIEDELAVSDITDTTILSAFAGAEIRASPPVMFRITPNKNSPLLFQDFDCGDFVRLVLKDGADNIYVFVRVVEATLQVDKDGTETLKSLTVESLVGGKPYTRPEDLYREYLDDMRARQEMLERKVENLSVSTASPPSSGAGTAPPADPTYTPPPDPPPVTGPPPTPDQPPSLSGLAVGAISSTQIQIDVDVFPSAQATSVAVRVDRIGYLNTLVQIVDGGTGGDRHVGAVVSGLSRDTTYYVTVYATNAAGQVSAQASTVTFHNDI